MVSYATELYGDGDGGEDESSGDGAVNAEDPALSHYTGSPYLPLTHYVRLIRNAWMEDTELPWRTLHIHSMPSAK